METGSRGTLVAVGVDATPTGSRATLFAVGVDATLTGSRATLVAVGVDATPTGSRATLVAVGVDASPTSSRATLVTSRLKHIYVILLSIPGSGREFSAWCTPNWVPCVEDVIEDRVEGLGPLKIIKNQRKPGQIKENPGKSMKSLKHISR